MDVGSEHDTELQAGEEGESTWFYTAGPGTGSIFLPVLFSKPK